MVQKEVKKKTKIYGTVAVLSAIILVTMVYAHWITPNNLSAIPIPIGVGYEDICIH